MSDATQEALKASVAAMQSSGAAYDVTIVCTTDDYQAAYWMELLEKGLLASHKVLAVSEDWGGSGAGNGLGTLYAWTKACKLASTKYPGLDLQADLAAGKISAALFHTAGKGTRMAPMPASENNNKPGVRLPFPLKLADGTMRPLTVLESVIKQTGIYAASRKGRLSVYWGDQVFLPSAAFAYTPTHHVDILCTLLGDKAPTAEEWTAQGLEKYGVIAVLQDGNASQVEKVSHATATEMLSSLGELKQVGPSLGSFSVSAAILAALCEEYNTELTEKTAKLDTDPHFWMPLTLPLASYVSLMKQKGTEEDESTKHHARMTAMKTKFMEGNSSSGMGIFGAVDVGKDACWWDYGQLKLYSANTLVLREESFSANLLKSFLGVTSHQMDSSVASTQVDATSYVFCSKIGGGSVKASLLAGVTAQEVQADGAIIVNCAAKKIVAPAGSILYNVVSDSDEGIVVTDPGAVMVAVREPNDTDNSKVLLLKSAMDIDGGKSWKIKLDMNEMSFEDVHKKNKNADIGAIAKERKAHYDAVVAKLGM